MQKETFALGVNYWPRKKAMYWWKDFDHAEVEQEFAEIAALQLQVVRIFLLWEDFQPTFETISDRALANLGAVLDIALAAGIKVMPTFFTGHMSGINWWPAWALADTDDDVHNPANIARIAGDEFTQRCGRDPYADPFMLDAELRLVAAVCGRYGSHPAIHSWNFSNEPDLFYRPKQYSDSARWHALLTAEVRKNSTLPVSAGMQLPTIISDNGFRPDLLALHSDHLTMHAYSIYYEPTAQKEPLSSDVVPLSCLVMEALGGKRVLFEEFGYASSENGDISEFRTVHQGTQEYLRYFADDICGGLYYQEVLEKLARCRALGAFAWIFSDYDPILWNKPPFDTHRHERFFGLTRYDGTVKPSGEAMRAFARRIADQGVPPHTVKPLTLTVDEWYRDPAGNFYKLFQQWQKGKYTYE